ncbi:hypothetical protein [Acinetobacter sp. ANC 4648]|uniref:hypothetical protein n=1 Tax=Acinetobacter sp. ANC 4648 TaxID=1977875 RepID=UPI000A349A25|nr:hypothetical protein [Acinetobacter sp. ANC 4648]OTG82311.1 hypothetical protein B9T27_08735 [Acinetobacter sp. ANC 4648]
MNSYWKAYELSKHADYFDTFIATATNFAISDSRLELMKSINIDERAFLTERIELSKFEQSCIEKASLDIALYREVMACAFATFYTFCSGGLLRHPSYSDSNISTILFNTKLDVSAVGILNDHFSNALVDLLDKHDFDEL